MIIMAVYFAIFLIFYVVLPVFFHRSYSLGGFFPFFFFFPFVFGRRRPRSRNTSPQAQNQDPMDQDILNEQYDTREWEKSKAENYDEYGIRIRRDTSRYWYYIVVGVILAASIVFLLVNEGYLHF